LSSIIGAAAGFILIEIFEEKAVIKILNGGL
jgi:hypothetical protein